MDLRQAAQQALEALIPLANAACPNERECLTDEDHERAAEALEALCVALAEPDYWQEEARRYAGNADYWRKRYKALAEPEQEMSSDTRYTVAVEGQAPTYWDCIHDAMTNAQRAVYSGVDNTTRAIDDLKAGRIAEWSYGFSAVRIYPPQRKAAPTPQPEQAPVESISAEQLSKMFQCLEGIDQNQWGYHWRRGWNDALREAMDYCQAAPTPQPDTDCHLQGICQRSGYTLSPTPQPEQEPVAWAEEIIDDLHALHDTEMIRENDSGDALIRLDDAIACVEDAKQHYTAPIPCKPEQEPVAWMVYAEGGASVYVTDSPNDLVGAYRALPLYTAPPQRKPLTDAEILSVLRLTPPAPSLWPHLKGEAVVGDVQKAVLAIARAIEHAHGIGEQHGS